MDKNNFKMVSSTTRERPLKQLNKEISIIYKARNSFKAFMYISYKT